MQYRNPVGLGPSSKTCPRCASHLRHDTAVRVMPMLRSIASTMFSLAMGAQKLGQPVPDSNLVSELKTAVSQQMQRKIPLSCTLRLAPLNGRSVASCRVTSNEAGASCAFHSFSLFRIAVTMTAP